MLGHRQRPFLLVVVLVFFGVFFGTLTREYGHRAEPKRFKELPEVFLVLVAEDGSGVPRLKNLREGLAGNPWIEEEKLPVYREDLDIGLEILDQRRSVPEQTIFLEAVQAGRVYYCEYIVQHSDPSKGAKIVPQRFSVIAGADWTEMLKRSLWNSLWASLGIAALLALTFSLAPKPASRPTPSKRA